MRKAIIVAAVAVMSISSGAGCASANESTVSSDDSSVTSEDMFLWVEQFSHHHAVQAIDEDVRGLDPRIQTLSSGQCKTVLDGYDAIIKKAPMPPYKGEDFKLHLEESREAYLLACNGTTKAVLKLQVEYALNIQEYWVRMLHEEFSETKEQFFVLTKFPF